MAAKGSWPSSWPVSRKILAVRRACSRPARRVDQIERQVLPGHDPGRCDEALRLGIQVEYGFHHQPDLWIVPAEQVAIGPVGRTGAAIEKARLGQHQRARAHRGDQRAGAVQAPQPGDFLAVAAGERGIDGGVHVADDDHIDPIDVIDALRLDQHVAEAAERLTARRHDGRHRARLRPVRRPPCRDRPRPPRTKRRRARTAPAAMTRARPAARCAVSGFCVMT